MTVCRRVSCVWVIDLRQHSLSFLRVSDTFQKRKLYSRYSPIHSPCVEGVSEVFTYPFSCVEGVFEVFTYPFSLCRRCVRGIHLSILPVYTFSGSCWHFTEGKAVFELLTTNLYAALYLSYWLQTSMQLCLNYLPTNRYADVFELLTTNLYAAVFELLTYKPLCRCVWAIDYKPLCSCVWVIDLKTSMQLCLSYWHTNL